MSFKEQLKEDHGVYLNIEEFGEYWEVDGVLMKVVLQQSTEAKSGRVSENFEMLHGDFAELYFETAKYLKKKKRLPKYGDYVKIGERRYNVVQAKDEQGITYLKLDAYRQNNLGSWRNDNN